MKQHLTIKINAWIICGILLFANILTIIIWQPWSSRSVSDRTISVTGSTIIQTEPDEFTFSPYYQKQSDDLSSINQELIQFGISNTEHRGMGATLVGIMIIQDQFLILNAGDSPAWIYRNDLFFKLSEDHVLDPKSDNSPITSYFGGFKEGLDLNFNESLRDIFVGDIFVLNSDGLFKCITQNQMKAILSNSTKIEDKANFILTKALEKGSEDNVSCILIEIVE